MRARQIHAAIWCACVISGCYRDRAFHCDGDDARCAAGERCLDDRCAAPDTACPTGFRFTRSAGDQADQCAASSPDGGACLRDGDRCDDGDGCTENDTCKGGVCSGTPKTCPAPSCLNGIATVEKCVNGGCMAENTPCAPYACSGAQCGSGCAGAGDCSAGNYCASGKCLACTDVLAAPGYVPAFGPPVPIAELAAPSVEYAPYLAPDGLSLYFASDRAGGQGGFDLYLAKRPGASAPFSAPANLGSVNCPGADVDPLTLDGKTLMFASDRGGDFELLASVLDMNQWSFPDLVPGGTQLDPLSTPARELRPSLTGDGLRLYFASDRAFMPAAGDPLFHLYMASRAASQDPFGGAPQLGGLDPLGNFLSPAVMKSGGGLYLVNLAVPSRPEVAFVHLDGAGMPAGQTVAVHGPAPGAGPGALPASVSVTPDGCALLYASGGDLAASYRTGAVLCTVNATCGMDDGCCPANCPDLLDADCPYPRTVGLSEFAGGGRHTWLLDGETPPNGYAATGASLRAFRDPVPNAVALNRFRSLANCGGAPYFYVGSEMARGGFTLDRALGYVLPTVGRGTARIYRAVVENNFVCDEQLTFMQATCNQLMTMQGYTCDSLGFGVQP